MGSRPRVWRRNSSSGRAGRMKKNILDQVVVAKRKNDPIVLITKITTEEQWIYKANEGLDIRDLENVEELSEAALRTDRCARIHVNEGIFFIQPFNPTLRMIVVGAVHVAQFLVQFASLSGFAVTVVDPRGAFASEVRFPGVVKLTSWPDDALRELKPDFRTAVVMLSHDPKLDDPALVTTLNSEAFYVGALGSKKTHHSRCERLLAEGVTAEEISRIHAPIGLDIGARSPSEIAVSIIGEVVESLRRSK